MRATSQIATTITNLVSVARTALPDLQVFDGPDVNGDDARNAMWIGVDDVNADEITAATGSATWASIGNHTRDERFVVYAATASWTGDSNSAADGSTDVFRTLREQAFANVAAVETAIRNDPTVAAVLGNGTTLRQVEVQIVRVTQLADGAGSAVAVQFQFVCWCRI